MKKFVKNNILGFILGVILTGTISVSAYSILAKDVSYTPKDSSWNVDNVKGALDDLYTKSATYKKLSTTTTVAANNLLNGITAYDNNGSLITGNISTDCVSGTINTSDGYNTSVDKLVTSIKPSKFLLYPADSKWEGIHLYYSSYSTTKFIGSSLKINSNYTPFEQNISDYYTINNNGWFIHNWPSGYILSYMACK